jgi:hypothetical protein
MLEPNSIWIFLVEVKMTETSPWQIIGIFGTSVEAAKCHNFEAFSTTVTTRSYKKIMKIGGIYYNIGYKNNEFYYSIK